MNGRPRLWTGVVVLLYLCVAECFALPATGARVSFVQSTPALARARTAARVSCARRGLGAIQAVARGGGGGEEETVESSESGTAEEKDAHVVGGAANSMWEARGTRRESIGSFNKMVLVGLPLLAAVWMGGTASVTPVSAATTAADAATAVTKATGKAPETFSQVLMRAGKKAVGGGKSGAVAGLAQVVSLMWLRTAMNYQYRYGGTTTEILKKLYAEGGVKRFYQGVGYALVQQPLSRFGDTAANAGMVVLLDSFASTQGLPVLVKTSAASAAAAGFRIGLMPVDTFKTTLQVEGAAGLPLLLDKVKRRGVGVLFEGSAATVVSTFVGHYPWFATYNTLQASVPSFGEELPAKLVRNAFIGLCASGVSDCCSNSFRVIKTTKQTALEPISYADTVKVILKDGGVQGLFGRGLKTRLITNGLQGMMFSVIWKLFDEIWKEK